MNCVVNGLGKTDLTDSIGWSDCFIDSTDYNGNFKYSPVRSVESIKQSDHPMLSVKSVFPNPFTTQFTIRYSIMEDGDISFRLTDVNGTELLHELRPVTEGFNSYTVNTGDKFPEGVYLLMIQYKEEKILKKMILDRSK